MLHTLLASFLPSSLSHLPTEGWLTLGGVDYTTLSLKSLHAHIGVVSQETQLFNP